MCVPRGPLRVFEDSPCDSLSRYQEYRCAKTCGMYVGVLSERKCWFFPEGSFDLAKPSLHSDATFAYVDTRQLSPAAGEITGETPVISSVAEALHTV